MLVIHGCFVNHSGYAAHTRELATALNKLTPIKVRNFAYEADWSHLTAEQKGMLTDQKGDTNIILLETNHMWFYEDYPGRKIAYNVWECEKQPIQFFNKLLEFDQFWTPTRWQADATIAQGYPADRVFVVNEGVGKEFIPGDKKFDKFTYFVAGRWDYRKSIEECIRAFLDADLDADLIISVDNPFPVDGLKTTEERLRRYKLQDPRIKIVHFPPKKEYLQLLQKSHCFISCSRSEGWNLPLIEAMACGTISTYSDAPAQLEYADVIPETMVRHKSRVKPTHLFNTNTDQDLGFWNEPNWDELTDLLKEVYNHFDFYDGVALSASEVIREKFTWENAAKQAMSALNELEKVEPRPSQTPKNIENVRVEGKRLNFTWRGEEKVAVAMIVDGYTGLNYYRGDITLKPNTNHFIEHGYYIMNIVYELYDKETNELLLSVQDNGGFCDISKTDYEGHLKGYGELIEDDYVVALPLYEIFVADIYRHKFCQVAKGDVVVDIGANLGIFSLYAYYNGCKVCHAFEPVAKNYKAATEQLKNIPNIVWYNKAVDNYNGTAKLYIPVQETICATLYDPSEKYKVPQEAEECEVVPFMDLGIEHIDFLKLDCEGSEWNILDSMPDDYLKNIKKIAMEYHNNTGQLKKLLERLVRLGFEYELRSDSRVDGALGIVYVWRKFDFDKFIAPYEADLKRTGLSRYNFYKWVIPKLVAKQKPLNVVETGTMWADFKDNMGAFTLVFGDLIKNWTGGKLTTIDISEKALENCKKNTLPFADAIEYVLSDSVEYLKSIDPSQIDLFYLDSYDLCVPNPDPSATHHLRELEAIYPKLGDSILAVDDNYLPGTIVEWHWLNEDGSIKSSEKVNTGNKVIGKGSKVNDYLLERGWNRISEFDVPAQNNVFYYEKSRISVDKVSKILNSFYSNHPSSKVKVKPFDCSGICSKEPGLGDTMILTPFTEYKAVDCTAPSFPTLMLYNEHFRLTDTPKVDISEFAKYNWGGGHAIQRIARALGLPEDIKPKGVINIKKNVVKGRIGYQLTRYAHNQHCITDEQFKVFKDFTKNMDTIDLGSMDDLRKVIETIATCEYFVGINSGLMHIAAALGIKSIIIVNSPKPNELYLPRISEAELPEMEWLYPQNVHLHTKGSNELVPMFNTSSLKAALEGKVYPYWSDDYLDIRAGEFKSYYHINCHFINGAFCEVKGNDPAQFRVEFWDKEELVYSKVIPVNNWCRTGRVWYTDWLVKVYKDDELVFEHKMNLKGKKVLIEMCSKSLGDTLCWIPYCQEFKEKHNCDVFVYTHWNNLFRKVYPDLKFLNPGEPYENIYASYYLGCWEGNSLRNRNDWRTIPLQQIATDALGLPFREVRPKIWAPSKGKSKIKGKYVCISEWSTLLRKHWLYPNGWQLIVDYLNTIGYRVVVISTEKTNLTGIIDRTGRDIQDTINTIKHCEFYIGLGHGPAWVAWALNKPVVMISGFSDYCEFECNRITPPTGVCHGCFNDVSIPFDRGGWDNCPRGKDFECSKSITPQRVIEEINKVVRKNAL